MQYILAKLTFPADVARLSADVQAAMKPFLHTFKRKSTPDLKKTRAPTCRYLGRTQPPDF